MEADASMGRCPSRVRVARKLSCNGTVNRARRAAFVGVADSVPTRRLKKAALVGRHYSRTRVSGSHRVVGRQGIPSRDEAQVSGPGSLRLAIRAIQPAPFVLVCDVTILV